MNKSISPYDFGNFQVAENTQQIRIDDLLTKACNDLKLRLLQSQIELAGLAVCLTASKTRFDGKRLWFLCPNCQRRAGVIYKHPASGQVGCRLCLGLKYKAQRYKGMIENA